MNHGHVFMGWLVGRVLVVQLVGAWLVGLVSLIHG